MRLLFCLCRRGWDCWTFSKPGSGIALLSAGGEVCLLILQQVGKEIRLLHFRLVGEEVECVEGSASAVLAAGVRGNRVLLYFQQVGKRMGFLDFQMWEGRGLLYFKQMGVYFCTFSG